MWLCNVDLTSVPAEHLTSLAFLASSVTEQVNIREISGCVLVTFLGSVKSEELVISSQSLGSKDTWALVQAMESRVESV